MNRQICKKTVLAVLLAGALTGCQKEIINYPDDASAALPSASEKPVAGTTFTTYTIRAGQHYCEGNSYPRFTAPALYFAVVFDSSAVYQNVNPQNQHDENKLYGFADNNSHHQQYSARFGWRWCNSRLELSAYTYNNSVRSDKVLGSVAIGVENKCAIIVRGDHYDFVINGNTTSVPRGSTTAMAEGYKLLPYFGGDEVAPHTITIRIREEKG